MKKIILASLIWIIAVSAGFAQEARLSPQAEQQCSEMTRTMANKLRLNELGYIKLKALNRERFAATADITTTYKNVPQQMQEKLQALAATYEQELLAFLNPNQLQAYANYKAEGSSTKFVAMTRDTSQP